MKDDIKSIEGYRRLIAGEFTASALTSFEVLCKTYDKNESLSAVIEGLSSALGNIISLVKEDNQQEVIDSATVVIKQGLIDQQELIAEMAYGYVGHA